LIQYLDSSALVKRYVEEPGSAAVRALFRGRHHLATVRIGHAELVASLARRCREGRLTPAVRDGIFSDIRDDLQVMTIVEVRPALMTRVSALVTRRPLRGYDAVHLAAALVLQDKGIPVRFWVADATLAAAAVAEGLRTVVAS
jgi:predicted nucleic acid-binding protein